MFIKPIKKDSFYNSMSVVLPRWSRCRCYFVAADLHHFI